MTMSPKERVTGRTVVGVDGVPDGFRYLFSSGDLTIGLFNEARLEGSSDLAGLVGLTVTDADFQGDDIQPRFSDGSRVATSMREEDHRGPEALNIMDDEVMIVA